MLEAFIIFCVVYVGLLLIWWLICSAFCRSALKSMKRSRFDLVEMLDIGVNRLWRLFSFALLASGVIWGLTLGFWWLIPIALILMLRLYFFVSVFYIPFNFIESHYAAKVEYVFGRQKRAEIRKDRDAQIKKMKENSWTIPDSMK